MFRSWTTFLSAAILLLLNQEIKAGEEAVYTVEHRDECIILGIPVVDIEEFFLVSMNGLGGAFVTFERDAERLLVVAPFIESTEGFRFLPAAGHFPGVSRNTGQPVVAVLDIRTSDDYRIYVDGTKLFNELISGWPNVAEKTGGTPAGFSFGGAIQLEDGFEIWGVQKISGADLTRFQPYRLYVGEFDRLRVQWSLTRLLAPMQSRAFDPRFGFKPVENDRIVEESGIGKPIRRWRLQKRYPDKALSEPREPISIYLDPAIPDIWRPFVIRGIEEWEPAFSQAGFQNAIVVREVEPDDADWMLNSGRFTFVTWRDPAFTFSPSKLQYNRRGAKWPSGPGVAVLSVADARSGEIINGRIMVTWPKDRFIDYFHTLCAPALGEISADLEQEIAGELLRAGVAHEMGHILGLVDGNFGEFAYTTEQLRDSNRLTEYGFTPSIMNYSRCNYVAQSEDGLPLDLLLGRVGPADVHNIVWAYTELQNANLDNRRGPTQIDLLASRAMKIQHLRFYPFDGIGPQTFNNAVDVNDPVESSMLGLKNLARRMESLKLDYAEDRISDYDAEKGYFRVLDAYALLIEHAGTLVGGAILDTNTDASSLVYSCVGADRQLEALEFVLGSLREEPKWWPASAYTRRFQIRNSQQDFHDIRLRIFGSLLNVGRLNQLYAFSVTGCGDGSHLSLAKYLDAIEEGIGLRERAKPALVGSADYDIRRAYIDVLRIVAQTEKTFSLEVGYGGFYRAAFWGADVEIDGTRVEMELAVKDALVARLAKLAPT